MKMNEIEMNEIDKMKLFFSLSISDHFDHILQQLKSGQNV